MGGASRPAGACLELCLGCTGSWLIQSIGLRVSELGFSVQGSGSETSRAVDFAVRVQGCDMLRFFDRVSGPGFC